MGGQPQVYWGLTTRELAGTGMLSALAALFELIPLDLRLPILPNLTFDPTGIPIAIAGILYGPSAGVIATGMAGFVIATRNPISASFKAVAELATVLPLAAALYTLRGPFARHGPWSWGPLVYAWGAAVGTRVVVMTVYNYTLLPIFFPPLANVIVFLLLPLALFNVIQGLANVVAAHLIVDRLPLDLRPGWWAPPSWARG